MESGEPRRAYVDTQGVDDEAVLLGLAWVVDEARRLGESRVVLAVPQLSNLGSLDRSLGAGVASELRKRRRVGVSDMMVELATERDASRARGAATVAVWPTARLLERLEQVGPLALCVIPWGEHEVATWLAAWGPEEVRTGARADVATVSNPVVERALKSLTIRVNLSTGLGHPSDREAAIDMFRILRGGGESWDPSEVHAWALQNRWGAKGARELSELATAIREGKRVKGPSRSVWIDGILEQWRAN